MNIEQLYYFYQISLNNSFSKAAVDCHVSQSSLSKQIAKLEQELDVQLFNRSSRQIFLTKEGEQFFKDVQILLKDYEIALNNLKLLKQKDSHTIKIAMLPIFSQYDLAYKFHNFSIDFPNYRLVIEEKEERDIEYLINYNDYDLYILRGDYSILSSFHKKRLYEDSLICVVPKNHPLSHHSSIDLNDLKDEKLILPPQYTAIAKTAMNAFKNEGIQPHIIKYVRNETILSSVYQNLGIGIMMKKSLHIFHIPDVKIIPLSKDIHCDILLYSHNTEAVQIFIDYIL